jgi:hypothetical protein
VVAENGQIDLLTVDDGVYELEHEMEQSEVEPWARGIRE